MTRLDRIARDMEYGEPCHVELADARLLLSLVQRAMPSVEWRIQRLEGILQPGPQADNHSELQALKALLADYNSEDKP